MTIDKFISSEILYVNGKAYIGKQRTKKQINACVCCKDICALAKGCTLRNNPRKEFGYKSCADFIGIENTYFVPVKEIGGI